MAVDDFVGNVTFEITDAADGDGDLDAFIGGTDLESKWRALPENEIRIDLDPDPARDATRACFALADHPGIFSRLAGALALVGANVVDARTYTSKDGYATAVFWVQDSDGKPYEVSRLPRLSQMIDKTLKGEVVARDALPARLKAAQKPDDPRLYLRADSAVPYGDLMAVMDLLRDSGFAQVALVAEERAP